MKQYIRQVFYCTMAGVLASVVTSCGGNAQWHDARGAVWNTLYNISYKSTGDLTDSIIATFHEVEMSVSPFAKGSVIQKINDNASDTVDAVLADVFGLSVRINRESNGLFDPTMAPLVNLWGFGYENHDCAPTAHQIDSALALVGIDECHIDFNGHMVKKSPGTQFNFSAIAKGYGADAVGRMLERNGCTDYMVEIGGEIAVKGRNSKGDMWRIMIDAPEPDTTATHRRLGVMRVTDCGIATSGDYRNYRESDGMRVAHTISPVTGRPVIMSHNGCRVVLSSTVIASTAACADGLATACMMMAPEEAVEMVESKPGRAVLLVVRNEDEDKYEIVTSASFPEIYR